MQLDELCDVLMHEVKQIAPGLSTELITAKRGDAVTLHVHQDGLKLHLEINCTKLRIDGSIRTPRFSAKVDISKTRRIYQKDGRMPAFWQGIDTAIRQ